MNIRRTRGRVHFGPAVLEHHPLPDGLFRAFPLFGPAADDFAAVIEHEARRRFGVRNRLREGCEVVRQRRAVFS